MLIRRARPALFITILLFFILALTTPLSSSAQGAPTPYPTYTFYPTYTLYPTYTFYPTYTPLVKPSNTPLPTRRSTITRTPTITKTPNEVGTETAVARAFGQTMIAIDKNLTADYAKKQATELAAYKPIEWRELVNYANKYVDTKVYVRGRIFHIAGNQTLQMYIAGTYEAVYVETREAFSRLYDNDVITVYGTVGGYKSFENAYGQTISQPYLMDAIIVKR